MKRLNEIKRDAALINTIDWDMTPEEAVRLYLEWGNNWARSNYVIRSKNDISHYFVLNTWKDQPIIYLIRRNSEAAEELAEIEIPDHVKKRYFKEKHIHKGVWALDGEIKEWLQKELDAA